MVANNQQLTLQALLKPLTQRWVPDPLILGSGEQLMCTHSEVSCRKGLRELFPSPFIKGHAGLCYV